MKKLFIIFIFCTLFAARAARAAVVSILPPSAANQVVVGVDTQGESINAIEAHFVFDPREFTVQSVSDAASIINVWLQGPSFSNTSGTVDLSGIIPGGITTASGTLVTITIVPLKTGMSKGFTVASTTLLLNDGKGTAANLVVTGGRFPLTVAAAGSAPPPATTSAPFDTQGPDPFTPQIGRDPGLFNGQYFLAFAATDHYSGIDHYEVMEQRAGEAAGTWRAATSPYLLTDQTLASTIYVRAVDQAGNFRVVSLSATNPAGAVSAWYRSSYATGFGILIVIGALWLAWRKRKKRS